MLQCVKRMIWKQKRIQERFIVLGIVMFDLLNEKQRNVTTCHHTIKWDHEKLKLEGCVICQSSMISYGYSLTVMKTRDEVGDL